MKKILLTGLLATSISAQANEDINYSFLEIGYGYLDYANNLTPDGFYLDAAFDVSDHFYMGGHVDKRNSGNSDFDRYDLSLGFHTNGSSKTDFYTEFRVGNLNFGNIDGSTMGIFAGTRTAFNEKFELITKIGVTNLDDIDQPEGNNIMIYEADVKGVFKFTKNQAFTGGVESYDGKFGAKIGYRYSF
jgi:hypothetical protein